MALLEVCVDSLPSLDAALAGGAQRIELCARLDLGGLTPSREFVERALERAEVACHVMLRPREAGFVFTAAELESMRRDLGWIRESGASGVVLGLVTGAGEIEVDATRELLGRARPLSVTFHRALDETRDLEAALETLIELGVERVLTSGGAASAWEGRERLRKLVERAAGRIVVMPGGGVRARNAAALLAFTGARELHSSTPFHLRRSQ